MERFLIIVNGSKPLTIITKRSILDVAAALDPPLKTATEDTKIESLKTAHGFHQLISKPTLLIPQSSSCIDLIFTDQANFKVDSGVYPLLHCNRHHQSMYFKRNRIIKCPPQCKNLVWIYNKANVEGLKKYVESVNWKLMFGSKSVPKQVSISNVTLMNIFSNFTPNKLVTFDDKDPD